jgi:hypothetical protein
MDPLKLVAWDGVEPPTRGFSEGPGSEDHSGENTDNESNQGLAKQRDSGEEHD